MADYKLRNLGTLEYSKAWQAMRDFTDQRDDNTLDEIWCLEHPAVFTLGQAGKSEHLLAPCDIPVVESDRGGQVTYHGPGQLIIYLLLNLKRHNLGVRKLVDLIESSIIELLADYGLYAYADPDAPGVYVDIEQDKSKLKAKVAALGLRVRRGCSFHGLSLNLDMDLEPFSRINPCGYQGLAVTRLYDLLPDFAENPELKKIEIRDKLIEKLQSGLGYTSPEFFDQLPRA